MKTTQCQKLEQLLKRKSGVTSMEIISRCNTVAPHRRLADLKQKGWVITSKQSDKGNHLVYFGKAPIGV